MKEVNIICTSPDLLPFYATEKSAGLDLKASITKTVLKPGERKLIPTGIKMQLPEGYEAQIRPRSGLALKHGITVLNAPGTIDADYRGEIGVILYNAGDLNFTINFGDKIAQMVIAPYVQVSLKEVATLDKTDRNEGGFGSTGR